MVCRCERSFSRPGKLALVRISYTLTGIVGTLYVQV